MRHSIQYARLQVCLASRQPRVYPASVCVGFARGENKWWGIAYNRFFNEVWLFNGLSTFFWFPFHWAHIPLPSFLSRPFFLHVLSSSPLSLFARAPVRALVCPGTSLDKLGSGAPGAPGFVPLRLVLPSLATTRLFVCLVLSCLLFLSLSRTCVCTLPVGASKVNYSASLQP